MSAPLGPDIWQSVERIYLAARELSENERPAFLDRSCGNNPVLRREVESLLGAEEGSASFLDQAIADAAEAVSGASPADGERIGPYRVTGRIGQGGMGTVLRAVRDDGQYDGQVAIKMVSAPGATGVVDRFRRERQILANLDNPYIARLLDGGLHQGVPYIVMEHVDGTPITAYCRARALTLRDKLQVFRLVAQAVQHAHSQLVIHRDIKPANILITANGTPKLLDFGIAKILSADGADPAGFATLANTHVFTPEYASPEQVRGEPVGTPTDVYSLGVLLFELLTGQLPYEVPRASAVAMQAAVCDLDPPKPSSISPKTGLNSELDTIVLKALHKDPRRRYGSVEQFSEDVTRYLTGFPITARPDSSWYRGSKFVHRHKIAVTGLAGFVLALSIGTLALWRMAGRLESERDRAERVSRFLVDVFRVADPSESRGETVTAKEILDKGATSISADSSLDSSTRASMLQTIGMAYRSLGMIRSAEPLLEAAIDERRASSGERSRDYVETLEQVGLLRQDQGRWDEALSVFTNVLEARTRELRPDDPRVADAQVNVASILHYKGRYTESETVMKAALETRVKHFGPESLEVAEVTGNLASSAEEQARYAEAERLHRESIRLTRLHPKALPELGTRISNLAYMVEIRGDYQGAEELYRESLEIKRRVLGPAHPEVAVSLNNLGVNLHEQGRLDEAYAVFSECRELRQRVLGPRHPFVAADWNRLGALLRDMRRADEAEPHILRALALNRELRGEENTSVASNFLNLGRIYLDRENHARAREYLDRSLEMYKKFLGESHLMVGRTKIEQSRLLARSGDPEQALRLANESIDTLRRVYGPEHLAHADARSALGEALAASGRMEEARDVLSGVLKVQERLPAGHGERIRNGMLLRRVGG